MSRNKKNLVVLPFILISIIFLGVYFLLSSRAYTETGMILGMNENEIEINKVLLLNSFIKEDKQKIDELGILPEEYPGGFYRKDLNEVGYFKVSKKVKVDIFDTEKRYSTNNEKKHQFNDYNDFLISFKQDSSLKERHYIFTIKNEYVIKIEEKWYN